MQRIKQTKFEVEIKKWYKQGKMNNRRKAMLLAVLAGGALAGAGWIVLVSPKRALRCLPAAGRYFSRSFDVQRVSGPLPAVTSGNQVQLLVNGDEALPAMLDLIDGAVRSIRFQVMLFFPDEAGTALARSLARAAQRGVQVQLSFNIDQTTSGSPMDSYPAEKKERLKRQMLAMLEDLKDAGVEVRDNPPGIDFDLQQASPQARAAQQSIQQNACVSANHYDHRKLLIADGARAVIGGMNVGNTYLYRSAPDPQMDMAEEAALRQQEGRPEAWDHWFDAAVLVQGPVVQVAAAEFDWRWEVLGGTHLSADLQAPADGLHAEPSPAALQNVNIRFLAQRPGTPHIGAQVFDLIGGAQREIWVASPYVSYEPVLEALKDAARRGVRVVFVFPNAHQDVPVSGRIMRYAAPDLVEAGIELYYNDLRMAHTKILVADGHLTLIGSFNLNHRSFRHDLESALLIDDPEFAARVIQRIFQPYLAISRPAPAQPHQSWNPLDWIIKPLT